MKLKLVEPLRDLYKDEVRAVARALGVRVSERQPFPGPGLAVRAVGEVTPDRVALVRGASAIVEEEIQAAAGRGLMPLPWQYFAVLLPVQTVVDHGGQWTHREWRVLKYLGVETKIVANDTRVSELDGLDGLVLSGGAPRVGVDPGKMGRNGEYLDAFDAPILGICAGHQFMAKHLGGDAAPAKVPEFGKSVVEIHQPDVLFQGLPNRFEVWESHNDEVTILPRDFVALASSQNCDVQAMRHRDRPLFGLQFHPEVEDTQFGADIFRNFLKLCENPK